MGPILNDIYVIPTTDPHVQGAMWARDGVIVFSGG